MKNTKSKKQSGPGPHKSKTSIDFYGITILAVFVATVLLWWHGVIGATLTAFMVPIIWFFVAVHFNIYVKHGKYIMLLLVLLAWAVILMLWQCYNRLDGTDAALLYFLTLFSISGGADTE